MINNLKFIFRADPSNAGDWWSPPWRYFPFKPYSVHDILSPELQITEGDSVIVGGGGLGREYFRSKLDAIKTSRARLSVIWGAGVDVKEKRARILSEKNHDLYGDFFNGFNEVGARIFPTKENFRYVPCASCMNNLFFKYRDRKPQNIIGAYNHKRVPILAPNNQNNIPVNDNAGNNIEEKLEFLSRFEFIVTNTYHGVYWATLLQRKVICIPFKSGLFSFKHSPVYCSTREIRDEHLDSAIQYDDALEDCRKANVSFYSYLANRYDLT